MIAQNWEVWSTKVKVDDWHVSWPANEKRYKRTYITGEILQV
jgi:hypothetical protein